MDSNTHDLEKRLNKVNRNLDLAITPGWKRYTYAALFAGACAAALIFGWKNISKRRQLEYLRGNTPSKTVPKPEYGILQARHDALEESIENARQEIENARDYYSRLQAQEKNLDEYAKETSRREDALLNMKSEGWDKIHPSNAE